MERRRPSIRFPRPWTVILVVLLPGPIIMLLQRGAEIVQKRQSKDQRARVDVTTIRAALESYAMQHALIYPDSLAVLVAPDANGFRYLKPTSVLRDPWNREYVYVRGETVNVLTYGRDGVPGGTGDDADIDAVSVATGR